MTQPYWALAAGCVPDAMPWDIPRIARDGGFDSCGMWIDPETTWDSDALAKTRAALRETGVSLLDAEVLWLEGSAAATDSHKLALDAAVELGARNLLVVSRHADHDAAVSQFRQLCERSGGSIRVNIEFGVFTAIASLAAARAFITAVDHPAAGILIDLMHLNRSGETLPTLTAPEFSYVQACDFQQASAGMSGMDYIEAAVDGRFPLGEGEARRADLATICRSPLDVSLEIRSKALRDAFPDPSTRAAEIFRRCRRQDF